ncbi:MAG TPA: hypothetical protein VGB37_07210, partial [Candidatus Lokiarchaeia archaeon]
RFYRLYSEFGIPCYIIFDGDVHLKGTTKDGENIKKNRAILELLNVDNDYPEGNVNNNYWGFIDKFESDLDLSTSKKGLSLYKHIKDTIRNKENVPGDIKELIKVIQYMPKAANSVLKRDIV